MEREWDIIQGAEKLEQVDAIGDLGDPREIIVSGDTALYLVDGALNGLHRYDLKAGALSEGTGFGQGPGELDQESLYYLALIDSDESERKHLWLHDTRQARITIYDFNLEPVDQISITGSMRSLPISDSVLVNVPYAGEAVADLREFDAATQQIEGVDTSATSWVYSSHEDEAFTPVLDNFVLKYGPAAACSDEVVTGFDFASHLLRIRDEGIELLDEPEPIEFPVVPDLEEGHVRLPDWFNPRATLDLACDERSIYALFSGEGVSRSEVRSLELTGRLTSAKRAELSAEVRESDRLHVYDRLTGAFKHEVELPVEARRLAASEDYLYLLVHEGDGPRILRYAWTDDNASNTRSTNDANLDES